MSEYDGEQLVKLWKSLKKGEKKKRIFDLGPAIFSRGRGLGFGPDEEWEKKQMRTFKAFSVPKTGPGSTPLLLNIEMLCSWKLNFLVKNGGPQKPNLGTPRVRSGDIINGEKISFEWLFQKARGAHLHLKVQWESAEVSRAVVSELEGRGTQFYAFHFDKTEFLWVPFLEVEKSLPFLPPNIKAELKIQNFEEKPNFLRKILQLCMEQRSEGISKAVFYPPNASYAKEKFRSCFYDLLVAGVGGWMTGILENLLLSNSFRSKLKSKQ